MKAMRFLRSTISISLFLFLYAETVRAELELGFYDPYVTVGPRISPETLSPTLRKWYLPQTLYLQYQWKGWEYSNYARDIYQRYVDILLEGESFYDIYGDYITKGWHIYGWSEEYPRDFGSSIFKHPNFSGWFDNLLVSRSSKGQFHTALTVGAAIRTTLTPLTFSKPLFDGVQWDFLTDKYGFTVLASRANLPGTLALTEVSPGVSVTTSTNLIGLRGVIQVGDFVKTGFTYVNASDRNNALSLDQNSMKGVLSGALNAGYVRKLAVRLSDDSPEDGEGGALLFRERIFIDGVEHPEIKPLIEGGIRYKGLLEASGGDVVTLTYDIEHDFRPTERDKIIDFREIHKVEVGLVLANDYKVEVTSNMQTSGLGEPVFLLVTEASGNIKDGSNQKYVQFIYGLPTGNEVGGITFEVTDLAGFNLRGEYILNRRFRRFPNQSIMTDQALGTARSEAFYITASQLVYPWFAYGEVFSIDPDYSTSMFIPDEKGAVDYEKEQHYVYEFVDDNDDQDRYPDWRRRYTGPYGSSEDLEIFPGLDENNDLISDFNQNNNDQPDYVEPFLRYDVDPPEFLFGMDMNNNSIIDRFENDTEPDYPYKRDRRGYNLYTGVEISPGTKLMIGHLREDVISSNRRNESTYGLLTLKKDFPRQGVSSQLMHLLKSVRDNIPEDLVQWEQPPFSSGQLQDFPDPLIAQNTLINTTYLEVGYSKLFSLTNKFKYELYHQREGQAEGKRDRRFLGIINKADHKIPLGKSLSLWPRWKQMYQYMTPTKPRELKTKELAEIFSFLTKYEISKQLWIDTGAEYEIFDNLIPKPTPLPPGFVEDFQRLTFAFQLSGASDYLGYRLISKVGMRWNRWSREGGKVDRNTIVFMDIYAGAE